MGPSFQPPMLPSPNSFMQQDHDSPSSEGNNEFPEHPHMPSAHMPPPFMFRMSIPPHVPFSDLALEIESRKLYVYNIAENARKSKLATAMMAEQVEQARLATALMAEKLKQEQIKTADMQKMCESGLPQELMKLQMEAAAVQAKKSEACSDINQKMAEMEAKKMLKEDAQKEKRDADFANSTRRSMFM